MGRTINEVDKTLLIIVLKFSDVYNTKRYFNKIYYHFHIYARVLRIIFSKFIMEYCKWCKFTVLIRILINIIRQRDSILLTAALIVPCNLNFSIAPNSFRAFVSQHRWNLYNSRAITLFHDIYNYTILIKILYTPFSYFPLNVFNTFLLDGNDESWWKFFFHEWLRLNE